MDLNILTQSEIFNQKGITLIEEKNNARYVCETAIKNISGQWSEQPVAVFWNKDPANIPAGGSSPWFGMFHRFASWQEYEDPPREPLLYITNAISVIGETIQGIIADNGDVIYSRYRHDYRHSPDGSVWIDGGRDYTRTGPCPNGMVDLQIIEGDLKIVNSSK
jgi:hypothetical protein